MSQGLREFDFLGGAAFYKAQFTQTTRPIVTLRIARPSVAEWLRRGADHVIDWARAARNRFLRPAPKPAAEPQPAEAD